MKRYKAKLTADYKYTMISGKKGFETLSIEFLTEPLEKRPTQAFFKSCVKLAFSQSYFDPEGIPKIEYVWGLSIFAAALYHSKRKITNINFMFMEED